MRCAHVPSGDSLIELQYRKFWSAPNKTSCGWLALLFAVSGLGAEVSCQSLEDISNSIRAEDLRRMTAHALVLADYTATQPFVIEALMLQVKSLLLKHHDTTRQIYILHGQVMRLCWLGGYHRDPNNSPAIKPLDAEMRKRVWMLACEYDILTCHQVGMTSLINRSLVDVAMPDNYFDTDFSIDPIPPPHSPDFYTPALVATCYSKLTNIFGDIAASVGAAKFPSMADVEQAYQRLNKARDQLPQMLRFIQLDQTFADSPALILDRFRLEILHKRALCVLFRPFIGRPDHANEQERCLKAAEDQVRLAIPLLEATQPGGLFAGCKVFIRRHVHDFNLAAMLLCSGLKRQSSGRSSIEEQERSARVRPLLLKACTFWILSGVASQKAKNAVNAIEFFLLQGSSETADMASFDYSSDVNAGETKVSEVLHTVQPDTSTGSHRQSEQGSFQTPQEPFDLTQDPLLQDIFGSTYSTTGQYEVIQP